MSLAFDLHQERKARLSRFSEAARRLLEEPLTELRTPTAANRPFFPRRKEIAAQVCEQYGFTIEELKGLSRKAELVFARQVLMCRLRREIGMSLPEIGRFLNRDHTTAIHALKKLGGM